MKLYTLLWSIPHPDLTTEEHETSVESCKADIICYLNGKLAISPELSAIEKQFKSLKGFHPNNYYRIVETEVDVK